MITDTSLKERRSLTPPKIIIGLELCITSTYFTCEHTLYRQSEVVATDFPVSPVITNLYSHSPGSRALASFRNAPRIYLWCVDDTFVIMKSRYNENFLSYLNTQCDPINFTVELEDSEMTIKFLVCHLKVNDTQTLNICIHRKPTHSDW